MSLVILTGDGLNRRLAIVVITAHEPHSLRAREMTPAVTQTNRHGGAAHGQHRNVRWQADPECRAARGPSTGRGVPAGTIRRPARYGTAPEGLTSISCAAGRSVRYGHAFFGGVPTVIETADPKLTCAPASGLWFITVPRWSQELSTAVLTVPSSRPTACRAWLAGSTGFRRSPG
jgi:hypothetical protein